MKVLITILAGVNLAFAGQIHTFENEGTTFKRVVENGEKTYELSSQDFGEVSFSVVAKKGKDESFFGDYLKSDQDECGAKAVIQKTTDSIFVIVTGDGDSPCAYDLNLPLVNVETTPDDGDKPKKKAEKEPQSDTVGGKKAPKDKKPGNGSCGDKTKKLCKDEKKAVNPQVAALQAKVKVLSAMVKKLTNKVEALIKKLNSQSIKNEKTFDKTDKNNNKKEDKKAQKENKADS